MYIVIVGCGRLGSTLASTLSNEGHDIVIIDNSQENLDRLGSGFNGNRIKGVEIDNDTLIESGIENADICLVVTSDDNINIMAGQIAKYIFKVPRVIARIFDPSREFIYRKLGLETINPTELGSNLIRTKILEDGTDILANLDNNLSVIEIPIYKLKYKTVDEIQKLYNCDISSIFRNGNFSIAKREEKLAVGDKIICTINECEKERLISAISKE